MSIPEYLKKDIEVILNCKGITPTWEVGVMRIHGDNEDIIVDTSDLCKIIQELAKYYPRDGKGGQPHA